MYCWKKLGNFPGFHQIIAKSYNVAAAEVAKNNYR